MGGAAVPRILRWLAENMARRGQRPPTACELNVVLGALSGDERVLIVGEVGPAGDGRVVYFC